MKHRLRNNLFLFLAKILARPLLLLYRYSLHITVYRRQIVRQCRKKGENILYSFWHENMILPLLVHEKQGIHVLVSQHFDGEVIATILKTFGYSSIRGSSTRGGKEAFDLMKKKVKTGRAEIAFTPDGPQGPRREAKLGIVRLAAQTGSPIVPIAVAASRTKRLRSWDRLLIMLPFSRCALVYHPALYVPPEVDLEQLKLHAQRLTQITNELEKVAERCLFG